jgi:hypothetical protein
MKALLILALLYSAVCQAAPHVSYRDRTVRAVFKNHMHGMTRYQQKAFIKVINKYSK